MFGKIALVIHSLMERSDSIGFDFVHQYLEMKEIFPQSTIRIFCGNISREFYGDYPVENVDRLAAFVGNGDDAVVIYHWCDGWSGFDDDFLKLRCKRIVRWHNNTPPWFFAGYSLVPVRSTVRGYRQVLRLAQAEEIDFWVNSTYTARQLEFLGVTAARIHVVYPISIFLIDRQSVASEPQAVPADEAATPIRLLFVGRFVPHKGHKHLVAVADAVQRFAGRKVVLSLPGRIDKSTEGYVTETRRLAASLGVEVSVPGEVSLADIRQFYASADVFVCLSEHEGFGLPIFEAMGEGLPVVGLKWTAVGDFLKDHPLAVDAVDYEAIARRVVACLSPDIRSAVLEWQRSNILKNYELSTVRQQITSGLSADHSWPDFGSRFDADIVDAVEQVASRAPRNPSTRGDRVAGGLARDTKDRFVTHYDINAFEALLDAAFNNRPLPLQNLYEFAWREGIPRKSRLAARLWRVFRKLSLSLNIGTVASIDRSSADLKDRIGRVESEVYELRTLVETAVAQLRRIEGQASLAIPGEGKARQATDRSSASARPVAVS